ncbi:hypothetical protein KW842_05510 [Duganella sp. sic0402]|uniref:hypothetical protein n=1 Tax=Duganella sp. sic0402 TaxID=2854786 RepID=UPI001C470D21|nr:hypothetical protein [Duganella sp. sic0402]MBV7535226.1 hypothetical protein [Duganella sp. sic0402]
MTTTLQLNLSIAGLVCAAALYVNEDGLENLHHIMKRALRLSLRSSLEYQMGSFSRDFAGGVFKIWVTRNEDEKFDMSICLMGQSEKSVSADRRINFSVGSKSFQDFIDTIAAADLGSAGGAIWSFSCELR